MDFVGLDQGHDLEQFIEGAEAARHDDHGAGVFEEHHLTDEEIMEVDPGIDPGVAALLVRQLDAQPDAGALGLGGPSVAGLHDARTTAGDDGKTAMDGLLSDFLGGQVIGVRGLGTG